MRTVQNAEKALKAAEATKARLQTELDAVRAQTKTAEATLSGLDAKQKMTAGDIVTEANLARELGRLAKLEANLEDKLGDASGAVHEAAGELADAQHAETVRRRESEEAALLQRAQELDLEMAERLAKVQQLRREEATSRSQTGAAAVGGIQFFGSPRWGQSALAAVGESLDRWSNAAGPRRRATEFPPPGDGGWRSDGAGGAQADRTRVIAAGRGSSSEDRAAVIAAGRASATHQVDG